MQWHSTAQRKFIRPTLPPSLLHREALLQRLNDIIVGPASATESSCKLVLLHAPAGYGKTTLLADFARQTTIPCCWYLLDRSDTDTITFIECLLASIRSRFPRFGVTLDPLLTGARAGDADHRAECRIETVMSMLIEALATEISERFALVLCNYHEVNTSHEITNLINQLLQHPTMCVLVIESRALPDLDFASLLANSEMHVMSSMLFRLSIEEISILAYRQGVPPLSDADAAQLAEAFDGWITGILLGTRLGNVRFLPGKAKGPPLLTATSELPVDRQFLFAYVVNEVFTQHPNVYAFLKDVCILREMTPSICDALLGTSNATEHLYYLEQHGLFVSQTRADPQITYTCHSVLRELLADELARKAPERFVLLHTRAAELLGGLLDYEHAFSHALIANAGNLAARLILEASDQLFSQGHIETLARWIDALPESLRVHSPKLLLIRAQIHCMVGDYHCAFPLVTIAQELIVGHSSEIELDDLPTLQAEIALVKANVLFHKGSYQEAEDLCHEVLASLSADEVTFRREAHMRLGVCNALLGNFTSALTHLRQALQLWGHSTTGYQVADVHSVLVNVYISQGNFALAEHHIARSIACREQTHDVWGKVYDLVRLGNMKHDQGAFAEAEAALTEAFTLSTSMHFPRGISYALVNLGTLYQDQGLYERSLAVLEEGLALTRQLLDTYLTNCTLCYLAMSYLSMRDTVTASLLVSETHILTNNNETLGFEQAQRELSAGMIFYYQHRYAEAYACLHTLEDASGHRQLQLRSWFRLAACALAQEQMSEVIRLLETITAALAITDCYEHLGISELRNLPALEHVIKTLPEAARLRDLLHLETNFQENKASIQSVPSSPKIDEMPAVVQQPRLRILALGEPTVFIDEKPVTHWRMARAMELFFYLLDCGRPVRKEQILTALWPEVDERTDHTLHSTIYYVRKALGDSCIISQKGTYVLNLSSLYRKPLEYDVAAFQNYYTQARQALTQEDDATARTAFLAMIDLYRSDYVQSFYSDWCSLRRDELRTAYLDARHHLAQISWRSDHFEESATHWQHMLAVDTCQEGAHYGLMRCYLRQGKRGLALRQYQRCKETLQEELGIQPGPTIENLYQRLTESSAR